MAENRQSLPVALQGIGRRSGADLLRSFGCYESHKQGRLHVTKSQPREVHTRYLGENEGRMTWVG